MSVFLSPTIFFTLAKRAKLSFNDSCSCFFLSGLTFLVVDSETPAPDLETPAPDLIFLDSNSFIHFSLSCSKFKSCSALIFDNLSLKLDKFLDTSAIISLSDSDRPVVDNDSIVFLIIGSEYSTSNRSEISCVVLRIEPASFMVLRYISDRIFDCCLSCSFCLFNLFKTNSSPSSLALSIINDRFMSLFFRSYKESRKARD